MTTQDQTATTRLWTEYKSTADRAVRDQLIVMYSPLVKFVAGRVAVGLPQHVEQADLVSYGVIGLIDAIERFDPVRQVKFETYAIPGSRARSSTSSEPSTGCRARSGRRRGPWSRLTPRSRLSC